MIEKEKILALRLFKCVKQVISDRGFSALL